MALEMFQKGTWIWPKELTTAEPCPASPIPNVFYRFMFAHRFVHGSSVRLPAEGTVLKMTLAVRMPAFQSRADPWLWEAEITQSKSWALQWALGSSLQLYRMVWYLIYRLETMGCFNLWNINFMTEVTSWTSRTKRRKRMWASVFLNTSNFVLDPNGNTKMTRYKFSCLENYRGAWEMA